MILMPMGQENRANLVAVFRQIADIGNNNVDAQQLFFGEHQPGIDNKNVILPTDGHAVHAELAEATQRNYLQFILCHQPLSLPSRERRTPADASPLTHWPGKNYLALSGQVIFITNGSVVLCTSQLPSSLVFASSSSRRSFAWHAAMGSHKRPIPTTQRIC